tara:strand:- start:125 stop:499 length:375 start_codon:yes stop_codon:yes gene_type:complete
MSNQLSNLILATLGNLLENGISLTDDPVEVANALSAQLTAVSWQQLAAVTGATLEQDGDGQLVLYTDCYVEQPEPKIIYARELTPEEEAKQAATSAAFEELLRDENESADIVDLFPSHLPRDKE